MIMQKRGLLHNRKAQVTIFMIIGIILLFSTALIFYIKGKVQIPQEQLVPGLEQTPDVLKPVRLYVEGCANQKLDEGLTRAMEHGGLIYTDNLAIDLIDTTEGEGVEYFPDSDIKIPYWVYLKSKNDCTAGCEMSTAMPPLCKSGRIGCIKVGDNSVEEQLERYIKEELKSCLRDFDDLKKQGYSIKELSNITVNVNIRENDAVALINYELEVENAGSKTKIKDYYAKAQTKISKMYDIAMQIVNYTTNTCLYERYTLDLIATYSGLETGDLPPTAQTTFAEKARKWTLSAVKDKLDNVMNTMISMLRVYNTSNDYINAINSSGEYKLTKEAVFSRTVYRPIQEYQDVEIHSYYYPWWNSYLKIQPSSGSTIGPSNEFKETGGEEESDIIRDLMSLLSYKEYFLTYQYSYPIVTEITYQDDKGQSKLFRYAQEVNLRAGTCMKPSTSLLSSPAGKTQTLLCDEDMRENTNTTILVYDDYNQSKLLEGVDVYFYAGERCPLGTTDENGKLITKMPQAYGWFLVLEKQGYLRTVISEKDIQKPIKIYLKPLISKNIVVKSINKTVIDNIRTAKTTTEAFNWVLNSSEELNATYDQLLIKLERIPDSYKDTGFKRISSYKDGQYKPATVDLTIGTYAIEIQMMDKRNYTIVKELDRTCEEGSEGGCVKTPVDPNCTPRGDSEKDFKNGNCYIQGYTCESPMDAYKKNSESEDSDFGACVAAALTGFGIANCNRKSCDKDEEILYNETNVTNIIVGGVLLDNTTKYYKINDYENLFNSENIIIYIFRQERPIRHHDLENVVIYQNWSYQYSTYIMPRLT